jgi:hypothetical protein
MSAPAPPPYADGTLGGVQLRKAAASTSECCTWRGQGSRLPHVGEAHYGCLRERGASVEEEVEGGKAQRNGGAWHRDWGATAELDGMDFLASWADSLAGEGREEIRSGGPPMMRLAGALERAHAMMLIRDPRS